MKLTKILEKSGRGLEFVHLLVNPSSPSGGHHNSEGGSSTAKKPHVHFEEPSSPHSPTGGSSSHTSSFKKKIALTDLNVQAKTPSSSLLKPFASITSSSTSHTFPLHHSTEKNIQVFVINFMTITLKKTWLVIFVALVLVLGTTRAEVDLGRKVGFSPTKNPVPASTENGKDDSGVDNHHSYRCTDRPETGN
ncbi:hypothetical protein L1987_05007 [Smallanthus sonchifolius]|uniref:Uncharacterized protein n=1 Tax=Smallanthus sonchifolius TaxID=185202 RepID=A0ACB9JUA9_9ASTR|nr:hypothetical protein L1987_05007 [Smallanthus sonchifolius]